MILTDMFDLVKEIIQTMRSNKLRTALTGLSVAWGIFMLITLVSLATGVTKSFEQDMASDESQKISIWGGVTTKPYKGYRDGRTINLKNNDLSTLRTETNDVTREVSTELYLNNSQIAAGENFVNSSMTGVYPSAKSIENLEMSQGRFINSADIANEAKVVVLPQDYAQQLFPPSGDDAIGRRVTFNGLSFLVVGVYDGKWRRDVYVPYTTARVYSSDKENLGQITMILNDVESVEEAESIEKRARKILGSVHDFDSEDESAVWIWNVVSNALTARTGIGIMNVSVWVLGLLTLLSGIIGISNIMFVSVKERTHEIGIRRAIGARPANILTQILAESVVITTLFGYIGIIMGVTLTEILAMIFPDFLSQAKVDLGIAAQVTVVLIVAGALAGLFPALKALKVKPVEALRDE